MSKLGVWGKLLVARPRVAALGVAFAAVVGMSVTSVGTAYATGQACGGVDSNLANVCVHIDGGSNIVNDAIGQLQVTGANGIGTWPSPASGNTAWVYYSGHIQVVNPAGKTLCNSITITLKHGAATSCESPNQGASPTGAYCTILWIWTGSEYRNGGQECMNVTK